MAVSCVVCLITFLVTSAQMPSLSLSLSVSPSFFQVDVVSCFLVVAKCSPTFPQTCAISLSVYLLPNPSCCFCLAYAYWIAFFSVYSMTFVSLSHFLVTQANSLTQETCMSFPVASNMCKEILYNDSKVKPEAHT